MKKILILLLVMGICFTAGCSSPLIDESNTASQQRTVDNTQNGIQDQGTRQESTAPEQTTPSKPGIYVTVYYQDKNGFLVPVSRKIDKQEGIARATITGLVDDAQNRENIEYYGLYPVLPAGTEVKGINIKEGTAVIDFNESLLSYKNGEQERSIISSIVYTLTEFKTVQKVKILVNGRERSVLKYGTDISGILNRDNILVNSSKANIAKNSSKADIFLLDTANEKYSYLLPVSMEYKGKASGNLPGKIIDLFGGNYGSDKLYSELPQKTKLRNVIIKDDLLVLDFNKELVSYGGGSARETAIVNQILLSMKQVKGINKVKILVEGKENAMPEGTMSNSLAIPAVVNNVMDQK